MASLVRSVDASTVFVRRGVDEDLKDRKLLPYLRSGLREGIGWRDYPGLWGIASESPNVDIHLDYT